MSNEELKPPDPEPGEGLGNVIAHIKGVGAAPSDRDRLTVIFTLTAEHRGEAPKAVDCRWSESMQPAPIETMGDREPYQRRLSIGKEWMQLDYGWLKDVGQIVIQHLRESRQTRPTPEEQAQLDARMLEVTFSEGPPPEPGIEWIRRPCLYIPPGQCFHLHPMCAVFVRCPLAEPTVGVRLHAFSK